MSVAQVAGKIGAERGCKHEARLLRIIEEAIASRQMPEWIKCVRRGSQEEDLFQKIDVVFETTDLGKMFLQVKSSFRRLREFERTRRAAPRVIGFVINEYLNDDIVLQTLVRLLEQERAVIVRLRNRC